MKPSDLVAALRRRFWLLLVLVLVAGGIAYTVGRVQDPVYKAEAILAGTAIRDPLTNVPNPDFVYGLQTSMTSVANAAASPEIAQAVSDHLQKDGLVMSPEELTAKLASTTVPGSTSMKLTVSDSDPDRAALIANTWGEEASRRLSRTPLLLGGDLQLTSEATPPADPAQPKPMVYLGLGLFLGLIVGLTFVVADEYYRPRFRSAKQAEEALGIPVLGVIPRMNKKMSASTLLTEVPPDSAIYDAYNEVRGVLIPKAMGTAGMIVNISEIGHRNPVFCLNLAISIAHAGRKVLLLDCDLRKKGITRLLELDTRDGMTETLRGLTETVPLVASTEAENVFIIATGRSAENPSDVFARPAFDAFLTELRPFFDIILISAPAISDGPSSATLASKAEESLVVIDTEDCPIPIASDALEDLERLGAKPSGLILSNLKFNARKNRKVSRDILSAFPGEFAGGGMHWEVLSLPDLRFTIAGTGMPLPLGPAQAETLPAIETAEEARAMGERNASIPPRWIEDLRAHDAASRKRAEAAILAYYQGLLGGSSADAQTISRIGEAIISFLKREGPYGNMQKEEMEAFIKELLEKPTHASSSGKRPEGDKKGLPR